MTDTQILYESSGIPVFQNVIYPTAEEAKSVTTGDVTLVQCSDTGLVYNQAFDGAKVDYDVEYQNEQALSPTFQAHLDSTLDLLSNSFRGSADGGIEIGCGKGYFLEKARERGIELTGYDPAYQGTSPYVVREYYQAGADNTTAGFFVLRHVLEHIPDPWRFLGSLCEGLEAPCSIYIEVPALEWIIENNAFYDIFYEHCNYFTLESLAGRFGDVEQSGYCFGGQYLYLIADLASFAVGRPYSGAIFEQMSFAKQIDHTVEILQNGRRNYIWGAGAKGVTMSNLLVERGVAIEAIIDINPVKQGGFVGKSAIPVLSPAVAIPGMSNSNVMIMNPNYAAEIAPQLVGQDINQLAVI